MKSSFNAFLHRSSAHSEVAALRLLRELATVIRAKWFVDSSNATRLPLIPLRAGSGFFVSRRMHRKDVCAANQLNALPTKETSLSKKRGALHAVVSLACLFLFLPTPVFAANEATVEVLGGGGGGGVRATRGGGGGGGGEYRRCTETLSVQAYTVTVGVGGTEDDAGETDSAFSGTGISMTADGGNGSADESAGTAGTGGASTDCDTADANFDGGTPGAGLNSSEDDSGGGGGGAGYGGKGGDGAAATTAQGGGGGEGASESAAGNNASGITGGTGGGGGDGGGSTTGDANGSAGTAGSPATYHIVGGGGGGGAGGPTARVGGACGAPGAGSGGGEASGAGNGCRGEVRIIYVDSEIDATGGTETTSGSFRIHTFTTSGTFTVNSITVAAAPTVTTDSANSLSPSFANLFGSITAIGGAPPTTRGFAYSTDSTLSTGVSTTTETGTFGLGSFTASIQGLTANTTYYYRAYAQDGSPGYGAILSFNTSGHGVARKMRLFEGFKIKLMSNKIKLLQQ